MRVLGYFFCAMVRKSGAVLRTNCINAAKVCFQIKELAGLRFIDPVAGAVPVQPFFTESTGRHIEVGGYPGDVFCGIRGRHGFTAVGTGEAVCFGPGQLIGFQGNQLQVFGPAFFQPAEEIPESFLIAGGEFSEGSEINLGLVH
jgi:hypothetical protein